MRCLVFIAPTAHGQAGMHNAIVGCGCRTPYGGGGHHKGGHCQPTQRGCRTRTGCVRIAAAPTSRDTNTSIQPDSAGTICAITSRTSTEDHRNARRAARASQRRNALVQQRRRGAQHNGLTGRRDALREPVRNCFNNRKILRD